MNEFESGGIAKPQQGNQRAVCIRLSVMMTFVFMPLSCWWVTVATYIQAHTGEGQMFSLGFVGAAYSTGAIGAMIAPMFWGIVADRYISAERIMCGLHLAGGFILWQLTLVTTQSAWWWMMLAYTFCFSPLMGLANAICFRHLKDVDRTYPPIRALATLSWIIGGWIVGYLAPVLYGGSIEATLWPMRIAVVAHVIAAITSLVVPPTKPLVDRNRKKEKGEQSVGVLAVRTVLSRSMWLPVACMVVLAVSVQFYNNFVNIFLNDRGVVGALGHLSWGQVTELGFLFLLPVSLRRLGVKWTLFIGGAAWAVRYYLLAHAGGSWLWLYWPAILMHGLAFSFTYMTIQIYADRVAPAQCRAAVQGVISVLMSGVGALVGSQLSSYCQIRYLGEVNPDWRSIWYVAAGLAAVPTIVLLLSKNVRTEQSNVQGDS